VAPSAMATPRAAAAPAGFPGAVEVTAPGAVERGLTGTDFSSTGFAAQATRATSAAIQNTNLIVSQTFKFQADAHHTGVRRRERTDGRTSHAGGRAGASGSSGGELADAVPPLGTNRRSAFAAFGAKVQKSDDGIGGL